MQPATQSYVQNLEILRRIAPILADVANCALEDVPRTRKIEIFFESLRSEFRLLGHKLVEISHSKNSSQLDNRDQVLSLFAILDVVLSAAQLATPMQLVRAIGIPTLATTTNGFETETSNYRQLCDLYTCINRLPPDARREYLDWNPLLIQVDLDDEVRQEFLNALDTCLDSVVKFSPKVPQTWYPEATTTIMKRVERLHDVLQEEAEPRGNDEYFLVRSHEAKLYLDWTWGTSDEGAEDFEVVFFGDDFAQEACIKMRPTTEQEDDEMAAHNCDVASDYRYNLTLDDDGNLWDEQPDDEFTPASDTIYTDEHCEITLDRLVHHNELNYVEKAVLNVILARSLVHVFGSQWLQSSWGLENISVFWTKRKLPGWGHRISYEEFINVRRPFISTALGANKEVEPQGRHGMHHFPEILRLGVLLMEIALGDRMGKIRSSLSPLKQNSKSQRNSTLTFAAHLYNECALRFPPRSPILQVFQRCKDHLRWIDFTKPKDVNPYDDQNFVAIIYRDIVRPLEEALLRDTRQPTPHDIFSLKEVLEEPPQDPLVSEPILPPAPFPKTRPKSRWKGDLPIRSGAPSPSHGSVLADIGGCKCSLEDGKRWEDEWYDENLIMHDFLQGEVFRRSSSLNVKEKEKLVKIAILDTGCDLRHPAIVHSVGREIGGIIEDHYDFIEDRAEITDKDGHGTHLTHLLFKTARYIKVYPARVFDGNNEDHRTPSLVAKAIMHAVDTWKVDIISMSFSLTGDVEDVKKAIEYAQQQKVLMFAAASNNRHNKKLDIGFPASLGDAVVCVNSHDGDKQPSKFSPDPRDGHANLAVLGEGVEAAWKNGTLIRSEGTSCSTPIAAAIAAIILDYSRQLKDRSMKEAWRKEANKEVNLMRNMAVIKWVMFNMMTRNPNVLGTKYNMVKPWYLFSTEDGRTEEQISKMLTDVVKGRVLWTSLH